MVALSEAEMIRQLRDTGVDVSAIIDNRDVWTLERWEMIPGPAESDFIVTFKSRDAYIKALYDYYLGSPVIVDGWEISLNRHPELTLEGIRKAIADASTISADDFEGIAARRRARTIGNYKLGKTRWEWALQYQFLTFHHETDPEITLRLRRDMHEAYIVR